MNKKSWIMVLGFLWLVGIAVGESIKNAWLKWKLMFRRKPAKNK